MSFVEPRFLGEEVGASNDDHPFADVRNGQALMNLVYSAVPRGPAWRNTVFVINYPFGSLCIPGVADPTDEEWLPLLQMAADSGWPLEVSQPV